MLSFRIIALALAMRESHCDPHAVNGICVGMHQEKPIIIEDANRIAGYNKYTLEDRLDPKKSEEICILILDHYLPARWTIKDAALLWREGAAGRYIRGSDHDQYIADVTRYYWEIRNGTLNPDTGKSTGSSKKSKQ
jgi:hypothetical protein